MKRRAWWRYGEEKRRRVLRDKWLSCAPMLWLALRQRGPVAVALLWPALFVAIVVIVVSELTGGEMWALWGFLSGAVSVAVYLSVASQATRFFAEARRTGLVELLLAAPLRPGEIVLGPWRALVRLFAVPVVLLIVIQLTGTIFSVSAQAAGFSGAGLNDAVVVTVITALVGVLVTVANLTALAWFGLWMGMTSRNDLLATLKTLVFVQVVPWIVISIVAGLGFAGIMFLVVQASGAGNFMASGAFGMWIMLIYAGLGALLTLAKDLFFWRWAKRKLMNDFREQATRAIAPVVIHAAASPSAPPVIRST
jgi:hypothetical protein